MIVGLTGGIASGKTRVSELLAQLGADIIDTDVIAHQVVAHGSKGLARVVAEFGYEVLDSQGELDRRALRKKVFADPSARKRLESILHPLISQQAGRELAASKAAYAVLVVPLLVEAPSLQQLCDRILVVDVPEAVQIERVCARDDISEEDAQRILAAQADRQQRLAIADDVLDNSGSMEALGEKVKGLHQRYLEASRQ